MFLSVFRRDEKNKKQTNNGPMETIIGSETEINGDINFSGTGILRIDGRISGKITAEQAKIIVGKEAFINAEIITQNIIINGEVQGNVKATETMELMATAKQIGDVTVKALKISEGAIFNGACDMLELEENSASANALNAKSRESKKTSSEKTGSDVVNKKQGN